MKIPRFKYGKCLSELLENPVNGTFQGLKCKSFPGKHATGSPRTSNFRRSHYQKTVTLFPGSAPAHFTVEAS